MRFCGERCGSFMSQLQHAQRCMLVIMIKNERQGLWSCRLGGPAFLHIEGFTCCVLCTGLNPADLEDAFHEFDKWARRFAILRDAGRALSCELPVNYGTAHCDPLRMDSATPMLFGWSVGQRFEIRVG